ncbi:LCP family protein required for cell wall assembly [Nocardia kruczakiae]|uniref:LCP family protein required for cell wall assembly n=1 Tax=Nocardia kruczakiae TaxID=261477 RepID=A0ABU1XJD0_9NOCA|nr:LCP family protein [Nocardia kruczakiae]MDR7170645.1 LCP family protein required for cell wall assembly [Nocardia kruczakiae]
MGDDDRRGRSSRPGGRAPWERYPAPDSDEAPRNRRADEPQTSKPITVHDLVQRVDSERIERRRKDEAGKRRTANESGTGRTPQPENPGRQAGNRGRTTDNTARPGTGATRAGGGNPRGTQPVNPPGRGGDPRDLAPGGGPRPAAAGPAARGKAPTGASGAIPTARGRKPADGNAASGTSGPAPDPRTRRPRPEQSATPAAPGRRGPDPKAAPPQPGPAAAQREPAVGTRPSAAPVPPGTAADPRRAAGASDPRAASKPQAQRPDSAATRSAAPVSADAQQTAVYRAPAAESPADRPATAKAPVADQVTDQLPVPDDESGTEATASAGPETVGKPPLSRLAASRQRRRRRTRLAARVTTSMCAVLALLLTGVGWNYLRATDNGFTQVSALDENSADIIDPGGQTGDENFLIVGTDTRAGVDSSLGAGTTDDAEGARSDTVMLVHIPANRSRVVAVSYPRDLDVSRPECEGWDNDKAKYTDAKFPSAIGDKLNATYALGGPKCLTKVIQRLSGLKISHFVGIDFSGFQSMVDTIGGVEVCTNRPLVDEELGTVLPNPGRQILNGPTALDYVRARHVQGEERSDYDRIHRQQLFLSSLLRSALSSKVLFDIGKLNGFISAFSSHAFMDNVNTKDLLMLGRSLQKVSAGAITFLTVPTAGTTSYGNEIPRESDIKAIFQAIIDDQPLPGEKKAPEPSKAAPAPAPPQLTAVDPNTVSVQVSNGSGVTGVASTAATRFAADGFQIYNVGNYSGGTIDNTTVRYSAGHEAEAATVASALPGAKLAVASNLGSIVEVALGADFSGTVGTPTAFGSPVPAPAGATDAAATPVTLPSDLEHVNAGDDLCK